MSTAYYALFHHVCEQAGALLVSPRGVHRELQHLAQRAFNHGTMKTVCEMFRSPSTPSGLLQPFWSRLGVTADTDIKTIAENFVDLQAERHRADYNPGASFAHSEAQTAVDRAQAGFDAWKRLRRGNKELVRLFALSLMLGAQLGRR